MLAQARGVGETEQGAHGQAVGVARNIGQVAGLQSGLPGDPVQVALPRRAVGRPNRALDVEHPPPCPVMARLACDQLFGHVALVVAQEQRDADKVPALVEHAADTDHRPAAAHPDLSIGPAGLALLRHALRVPLLQGAMGGRGELIAEQPMRRRDPECRRHEAEQEPVVRQAGRPHGDDFVMLGQPGQGHQRGDQDAKRQQKADRPGQAQRRVIGKAGKSAAMAFHDPLRVL